MSADDPWSHYFAYPKGFGTLTDDRAPTTPVVSDDAAVTSEPMTDELARALSEDPIPFVVAEIRAQIEQLLAVHRELCDGIELATDQVQDKRIEFLEAGPEVTVADLFLEIALVFFLESRFLKVALRNAYRFIGDVGQAGVVATRKMRLDRLKAAADRVRGSLADIAKKRSELHRRRRELGNAMDRELRKPLLGQGFDQTEYAKLSRDRTAVEQELDALAGARKKLEGVQERTQRARKKAEVSGESLAAFFAKIRRMKAEQGVAAAKAAKGALDKQAATGKGPVPPVQHDNNVAPDSAGVQVKSLAQAQLRDMERYLGGVAADADLVASLARSNPFIAQTCFEILSDTLASLLSETEAPATEDELVDIKLGAMREFEKLTWALLVADAFPKAFQFRDPSFADTQAAAMSGPGGVGGALLGTLVAQELSDPPARLRAYLRARFFPGQNLTDQQIFEQLQEMKRRFLEKGAEEILFTVIKPAVFKKASSATK